MWTFSIFPCNSSKSKQSKRSHSLCGRPVIWPYFTVGFWKKLIIIKLLLVIDARSRFARSTIPKEKWGTTRSLVIELSGV